MHYPAARRVFNAVVLILFVFSLFRVPVGEPVLAEGEGRPLYDPLPILTIEDIGTPYIGENFTFNLVFSNTVDPGYGPFIDLYLPLSGADGLTAGETNDGISFNSASFLEQPVTSQVLTCLANETVIHPLLNVPITCPSQPDGLYDPFTWQMVVLTLPFGSYVSSQPPAVIEINAALSNFADLGVGLPIIAVSGFMFGADPLDNPAVDPGIVSAVVDTDPHPAAQLITLTKAYSGPEDETATGPNFLRQYTIEAEIADGQPITNLVITDTIPDNMQFTQVISTSPAATCSAPSTTEPGGTLVCDFGSAAVTNTVEIVFEYYIPLRDTGGSLVLNADSGASVTSCNEVSAAGSWDPLDPRDETASFTESPAGCEHTLQDKSIAVQKAVLNIADAAPAGNSPGDTLEYTIAFQVSDYFAFEDVFVEDVFSDGQHFDTSFTPTLTINGNGFNHPVTDFDTGNYDISCNYSGAVIGGGHCTIIDPATDDGTTKTTFRVSQELLSRSLDPRLIGGCVPVPGGTGGADPVCDPGDGGTTGTIKFRTVILEDFVNSHLLAGNSGDASVDQGDVLTNDVTIDGKLLDIDDLTSTDNRQTDTSNADIQIPYGEITKSIHAINSTLNPTVVRVAPGDTVTYRLHYTLPTSDFEDLVVTDYLPLPIFDVDDPDGDGAADLWTFNAAICGIPAAGTSCYGAGDTYHSLSGAITPTLAAIPGQNAITWTYGLDDGPGRPSTALEILFTVTVKDDPFADGLFLTNQAQVGEGSTNAGEQAANNIVQIRLTEPVVGITKGVVWTDRTDDPQPVFTPTTVGPVTFDGTAVTCAGRLDGTVTSPDLSTSPINSNVTNLDADDTVMMAVVLENTGRYDAFDVQAKDVLPAGMSFVSGSLCVTNGAGADLAYTSLGSGFFDQGIYLTAPLPRGKDGFDAVVDSGANIAVVTYLATLDSTVEAGQTYTNTATLFNFAGTNGGPDHTITDLEDDARVTVYEPSVDKAVTGTDRTFTSGANAAIGEVVEYTVTVNLPEGHTSNVVIQDVLDQGLAFVACDSITASSGVSSSVNLNTACSGPTVTFSGTDTPLNQGRSITYNLGDIVNANTDNAVLDTITIVYRAIVLNSTGNNRGGNRNNAVTLSWTGGTNTDSAENVTIVEPTLQLNKTASPTGGDAADTVNYTVVLSHASASNTDAFDVQFGDNLSALPLTVTAVNSPTFSGTCGTPAPTATNNSSGNTIDFLINSFPFGCSASFTYSVTVNGNVNPGQRIENIANTTWTSLPGPITDPSTYNDLDCERTGDNTGCGLTANDYTTSDPAEVTVNAAAFTKTITATGIDNTTNNNIQAVIGETIDYRLTLTVPEGEIPNLTIRDQLDDGLAFVSCLSIAASDGLATNLGGGFSDACPAAPQDPALNPTVSPNARTIVFNLGNITNSDTDDNTPETITINYRTVVLNVVGNQSDTTLNNSARPFSNAAGLTAAVSAPDVTVIEPAVTVGKSATIGGDAVGLPGQTVVYTILLTNTGVTDAFDVSVSDGLPQVDPPGDPRSLITSPSITSATSSRLGNVIGNFILSGDNASGWVLNTSTPLDMAVGETVSIVIQGPLLLIDPPAVSADQLITNVADMVWSSLDGDPGQESIYSSDSTERDGSGGVNDYASTDDADIRVENITLSKQLIDLTTGNVLTGQNVRIGETIGYRVTFTIPRDVYLTNLTFADVLDPGLAYADCRSITAPTDLTSDLTAAFSCANSTIAVTNNGRNLDIGFGNVQNTDLYNQHTIVLEYRAVVLNTTANNRNLTLNNQVAAGFTVNGGTTTLTAAAPNVTIQEPTLTVVKTVDQSTGDAGNRVTFTLTVTSQAGTNFNDAYNVVLEDVIPAGLTYVDASFTHDSGVVPTSLGYTSATTTLTAGWDSFASGQTSVFTFDAVINADVAPNQEITNDVDLTWTSMPGIVNNPSPYNDLDCERTGDNNACGTTANDYADDAAATVTVNDVFFEKTLTATSAVHTTGNNLTIGETADFALTITLPEGSIPSLVVTDLLPAGMAYVANSFSIDRTTYTGSFAPPSVSPLANTDGTDGQDVVVTFGQIDTTNNNITTDNTLVINLRAVVLNTLANQAGVNLVNGSTYQIGTNPLVTANTITMPVVEPELTITKTFDATNAPFEAGETVPYQLVISNTSGLTAFDVEISDTAYAAISNLTLTQAPSASLTGVDSSGTSGNQLTVNVAEFPTGSSLTINFDIVLPDSLQVGETVQNNAEVTWTSLPGEDINKRWGNSESALNNYYAQDDQDFTTELIAIAKTINKATATIGEIVRYTIEVTSPLGSIEDWVIRDTLPVGLIYAGNTFISEVGYDFPEPVISTPNDGSTPVTLTWTMPISTVITANTMTISYDVIVADQIGNQDGVEQRNAVVMNYTDGDDTPRELTTDVPFTILEPDLIVTKSFSPATVGLGQTADYTINLSHTAASATNAMDITINDVIPAGLTYVDGTIGGNCTSGTLIITDATAPDFSWSVDDLPLTHICTLTYSVTIDAATPGTPIINTVTVDYSTLSGTPAEEREYQTTDSATLTSVSPDLRIVKTDNDAEGVPGGNIAYAITYYNDGNGEATNILLIETVPAYTTFNDAATTSPWICTGSTCLLPVGSLAAGESGTADFVVTINDDIPAGITQTTNLVSITDDGTHGADPTPENNEDSEDTPLTAAPDLTLQKTDADITATPGNPIVYTLTYQNVGNQDATGVVITETVPENTTFTTTGSTPGWVCTPNANANSTCTLAISGTVAAGDLPAFVTFAVLVDSPLAAGVTQIDNTASIADDGANGPDPTPLNNTDDETTPVTAQPDLTIAKVDDFDPTTPGSTIVYTITYDNIGDQTATGVVITETVPAHTTFNAGLSDARWSCNTADPVVCTITIASLPVGGGVGDPIDFAVDVDATVPALVTQIDNTVTIADDGNNGDDPTPENNRDDEATILDAAPDLNILKDDAVEIIQAGQVLTYTLTYNNVGDQDATGVELHETVPAYTTYHTRESSPLPWVCDAITAGSSCTYTIGDLAAGASGSIEFEVLVDDPIDAAIDEIYNVVSINDDETNGSDPTPEDNQDDETTPLDALPDLAIAKSDRDVTAVPGGVIQYGLAYQNIGQQGASGVVITETVPDYTSFDAANSDPAWVCDAVTAGSTCTFAVGDLAAGDSGNVLFAVLVENPLTAGVESILNTVSITDDGTNGEDPDLENNSDDEETPVEAGSDLTITKDDGVVQVTPGEELTYTIVVANVGTQSATGVVVTDTLPVGVVFVSASNDGAYDDTTREIIWNLGALAGGGEITLLVEISVEDPFTGVNPEIVNSVIVTDDGSNGVDPTPENNEASDRDLIGDSAKVISATNQEHTAGLDAAVGEVITYAVTLDIAPGVVESLLFTDIVDQGMAFIGCNQITTDPADVLTLQPGYTLSGLCTMAAVSRYPADSADPVDSGRQMVISFGDVENTSDEDITLTILYDVVVLNTEANLDGQTLGNQATWLWLGGALAAQANPVTIVEPDLAIAKTVSPDTAYNNQTVTYTVTLNHTEASNSDAFNLEISDTLPETLTYVPDSLVFVSGQVPTIINDMNAPVLRVGWDVFTLVTEPTVLTYQARITDANPGAKIENTVTMDWTSLPGNVAAPQSPYNPASTERSYSPGSNVNVYGTSANAVINIPQLPETGFAPGVRTILPQQPENKAYQAIDDLRFAIPKQNLDLPIVGVPLAADGWDLTWLSTQVGYLEGTAYPTWNGNTGLTAHVYNADGTPGPFVNLHLLRWGDQVKVTAFGQVFTYEVRSVERVGPNDLSVLRHEDRSWLTLITCQGFNETTDSYTWRVVVRAVLVSVEVGK